MRGRVFSSDTEPAAVLSGGEHVFEDCTFASASAAQVIVVRGGSLTLRGCRVDGGGNRAIHLENATATIEGCTFSDNRCAVWCTGGSWLSMRDSVVHGPGSLGLMFQGAATGIVENCRISGVHDAAIMVRDGGRPVVVGCELSGLSMGVFFESRASGELRDCTIAATGTAVWIGAGCDPVVEDCRVEGGRTAGMYLLGGGRVARCHLRGHLIGFLVHSGAEPDVSDCHIEDGGTMGIYAMDGAGGRFARCRIGPHPHGDVLVAPTAKTAFDDR